MERAHDCDDPSHDGRHTAADHLIGAEDACGHDTDAGFCCAAVGVSVLANAGGGRDERRQTTNLWVCS